MVEIKDLKKGEVVESVYLYHIDSFYQMEFNSETFIRVVRTIRQNGLPLYQFKNININNLRKENGILVEY